MSFRRSFLLPRSFLAGVTSASSLVLALAACGGAVDSSLDSSGASSKTPATPGTPGNTGSTKTPTTSITPACSAPRCDPGDTTELGIAFCPPGATCYDRTACGQTVHCTSSPKGCGADPACPTGYARVASCLSSGTPDCLLQTACGQTFSCQRECEVGDVMPLCDPGDMQVASPSACIQDSGACYQRSSCGTAIWCTGNRGDVDAGISFPPPPPKGP